ncbi:hypothetical protein [Streptomyces sp. SID8352]|uniref:hypothetical protein n=1 Tax=Streptomyces sp. SID8352 TaxID=2690338 RepID=UPI00136FA345|nr:hypothetical protein [Streptomyces sp. SID8352]MYU25506.1 hypothetical protein [Streptomyces sp. SID8352]
MTVTSPRPGEVRQLPLPDPEGLTEDQLRGAVCVWGTARLTGESAVDLGEQTTATLGRWYPRACRPHAAAHGHQDGPQ